jgi:hypothetical protein
MREIAAFAVAALILTGVGSVGKWSVGTIRDADAAAEAGLNFTAEPILSTGVDTFGLMANVKDLPRSHYDDYSMVFN